jgi:PEP-CTERM motif
MRLFPMLFAVLFGLVGASSEALATTFAVLSVGDNQIVGPYAPGVEYNVRVDANPHLPSVTGPIGDAWGFSWSGSINGVPIGNGAGTIAGPCCSGGTTVEVRLDESHTTIGTSFSDATFVYYSASTGETTTSVFPLRVDFVAQDLPDGFSVANAAVPAIPEPSTWAMLLIGFAGIGFMVCRSKNKLALKAA